MNVVSQRERVSPGAGWWRGMSRYAMSRRAIRQCDNVGAGLILQGVPWINNLGELSIGDGCVIRSSPVRSHLITGPAGRLAIGSRVRIGHGAAITAHQDIQIADDVRLAAFVMIMDTDFHDVGAHGREGRTAPIRIERGVHIGAHVTILRGTTIGEGARVEAGSVVSGLVASGEHVAGVPARPAGDDAARAVDPQDPFAVSEVIRSTLGLAAAPGPDERLDELPGLDSLGLLNVLLSLEDRCGVSLSHKQILAARRVGHVIALVQQAPRSVVVTQ